VAEMRLRKIHYLSTTAHHWSLREDMHVETAKFFYMPELQGVGGTSPSAL